MARMKRELNLMILCILVISMSVIDARRNERASKIRNISSLPTQSLVGHPLVVLRPGASGPSFHPSKKSPVVLTFLICY
jgi:hypothetical protein